MSDIRRLNCPSCGSQNIHPISETEGSTKGFDCCLGALGALLFGWAGWLCGLCGMGEGKTTTRTFWICNNCGNKFA